LRNNHHAAAFRIKYPVNRRLQSSVPRIVAGILCLPISYVAFRAEPIRVLDKEGKLSGDYDVTAWFRVIALIILALGAMLIVGEVRRWSASESERGQSNAAFFRSWGRRFLEDGPLWLIFNLSEIALGAYMGLRIELSSNPDVTNSSGLLCIGLLVTMTIFVLGVVSHARGRLRAPSLRRFSLNWLGDPLQALFVGTLATLALILGGVFRAGIRGLWNLAPHVSILAGLLVGQAIVYRVFRSEIQKER
jgi:hypothetical protein